MIEKIWFTEAGYRAIVLFTNNGYRCGYVEIPNYHVDFGKGYNDVDVYVHGGLTFSSSGENMVHGKNKNIWVLGFDCGHYDDARDLDAYETYSNLGYIPKIQTDISDVFGMIFSDGEVRSLDYVVSECELLAKQLKERE